MNIAPFLDYTLLESTATEREIIELCNKARENRYYSVCVNGCYVALAKHFLENSTTKVAAVIGFPLGSMTTCTKIHEAEQALKDGAEEISMVINLGFLKSKNYAAIYKEMRDIKKAIGDTPLKVIIEISELSKNEIVKISEICIDARVNFIETSSGFSKSGATLTAIKIIKKTIKDRLKIKASGDIMDYESAVKYLEVGADRIGITTAFKDPNNNTRPNRNSKVYMQYLESTAKKIEAENLNPISKKTSTF